jgi:LacI family transcriptional regulator
MVTVKDIARLAGVSLGTVDRVIHNRGRVAGETAARVQQAIETLGYSPNLHARQLSRSRTYQIALLMPDLSSDGGYWEEAYQGIERARGQLNLKQIEFQPLFFNRNTDEMVLQWIDHINAAPATSVPDGVMVAPVVSPHAQGALAGVLQALHIPTVTFDSPLYGGTFPFVGQDPEEGGRAAARLTTLLAPPTKTIVLVTRGRQDTHLLSRAKACADHIKTLGDWPTCSIIIDETRDSEYVAILTARLQKLGTAVGALFVTNAGADLVVQARAKARLPLPVPIVGYDLLRANAELLRRGSIDFIISQRPERQGYEAAMMLINNLLFEVPLTERVSMPVEIVLPETVK